jgi:hypothetical protein
MNYYCFQLAQSPAKALYAQVSFVYEFELHLRALSIFYDLKRSA